MVRPWYPAWGVTKDPGIGRPAPLPPSPCSAGCFEAMMSLQDCRVQCSKKGLQRLIILSKLNKFWKSVKCEISRVITAFSRSSNGLGFLGKFEHVRIWNMLATFHGFSIPTHSCPALHSYIHWDHSIQLVLHLFHWMFTWLSTYPPFCWAPSWLALAANAVARFITLAGPAEMAIQDLYRETPGGGNPNKKL